MFIKVRVIPGARRERVEKTPRGQVISVREEAHGNAANERVREIVAREHDVPLSAVRLVKGQRSPVKTFVIGG